MSVKSVYVLLEGKVQGVGFRHFILVKAEELQITGWVHNTPEGNVEIEAVGESANLNTFIDWIKIGPSRAIIQSFSVSDRVRPGNYTNFTVR